MPILVSLLFDPYPDSSKLSLLKGVKSMVLIPEAHFAWSMGSMATDVTVTGLVTKRQANQFANEAWRLFGI